MVSREGWWPLSMKDLLEHLGGGSADHNGHGGRMRYILQTTRKQLHQRFQASRTRSYLARLLLVLACRLSSFNITGESGYDDVSRKRFRQRHLGSTDTETVTSNTNILWVEPESMMLLDLS
jgi:hypothetical protein